MPATDQTVTIMLVDDEDIALSSMNALFSLETEYELVAFNDPLEAIKEAGRTPIDLVISDYLMPQMTGIDLLKELQRLQPEMVRVLLTGFADKENTIRAINELDLFQYLEKPWDNQQLLLVVERGLQQRGLRKQLTSKVKELDQVISEHRSLQQRHSTLERELEMAARVQRSLLPDSMPDAHGYHFSTYYQPCHEIGGDYYGLQSAGGSGVLMLADVSGHGIQAALTSTLLKAIYDTTAGQAENPPDQIERMNDALHRFLPSGMYSAATMAWMGEEPGELFLINAGNPFPFILRAEGKQLEEIPIAGMPLGIFGKGGPATFDEKSVVLEPGDILLLASDGIGDVTGADDEMFADRQLREVLTSLCGVGGDRMVEVLLEKAMAFAGDRPIPDDISMVAVTRL
jgi:phosphoserine phosphatase RsbU/P